jgi:hypothetical protein
MIAVVVAMIGNLAIANMKFIAAALTGSPTIFRKDSPARIHRGTAVSFLSGS